MPNPFASNVHQDIVDQAQQDQLLQAAMQGNPQARAQLLAQIRATADPYHQQFIDYQEAHGGVSPQDLSKMYLQAKTGNAQSPVYYDPASGQYRDQQKDSKLFKVAQYAPGIIGGAAAFGPALMGGAAAEGGGGGAAGGLGSAGYMGGEVGAGGLGSTAGGLGAAVGPEGVVETIGNSGGVSQALGPGGTNLVGTMSKASMLGPLLNTGLRLGSAAIGSRAAGKASQQQQQNIQKGLDLQANLYGQSRAALMPYYQLGAGSLGRLGSFLGTQPAAPIPAGTLGNLGK